MDAGGARVAGLSADALALLQPAARVDARDSLGMWYNGTVVRADSDSRRVLVKFDMVHSDSDVGDWVPADAIAPLGTRTYISGAALIGAAPAEPAAPATVSPARWGSSVPDTVRRSAGTFVPLQGFSDLSSSPPRKRTAALSAGGSGGSGAGAAAATATDPRMQYLQQPQPQLVASRLSPDKSPRVLPGYSHSAASAASSPPPGPLHLNGYMNGYGAASLSYIPAGAGAGAGAGAASAHQQQQQRPFHETADGREILSNLVKAVGEQFTTNVRCEHGAGGSVDLLLSPTQPVATALRVSLPPAFPHAMATLHAQGLGSGTVSFRWGVASLTSEHAVRSPLTAKVSAAAVSVEEQFARSLNVLLMQLARGGGGGGGNSAAAFSPSSVAQSLSQLSLASTIAMGSPSAGYAGYKSKRQTASPGFSPIAYAPHSAGPAAGAGFGGLPSFGAGAGASQHQQQQYAEAEADVPELPADAPFQLGDPLDACDRFGTWYRGEAVDYSAASGDRPALYLVRYADLPPGSEEWVPVQNLALVGTQALFHQLSREQAAALAAKVLAQRAQAAADARERSRSRSRSRSSSRGRSGSKKRKGSKKERRLSSGKGKGSRRSASRSRSRRRSGGTIAVVVRDESPERESPFWIP